MVTEIEGLHEYDDQSEDDIPPMINESEEQKGQYARKKKAMGIAKRKTQDTGRWHDVIPRHCWRNGMKKTCWSVILVD